MVTTQPQQARIQEIEDQILCSYLRSVLLYCSSSMFIPQRVLY